MNQLPRARVRALMEQVLITQGRALPADDGANLRDVGFRSLDFSELTLRVEDEIGEELNFDAPALRSSRRSGRRSNRRLSGEAGGRPDVGAMNRIVAGGAEWTWSSLPDPG